MNKLGMVVCLTLDLLQVYRFLPHTARSSLQRKALRNDDSKEIISAVKSNALDSMLIEKLERLKYDFQSVTTSGVPRNFVRGGLQQIQLRTEDRKNGDLGAVAPSSGVLQAAVIWYKKFHFI